MGGTISADRFGGQRIGVEADRIRLLEMRLLEAAVPGLRLGDASLMADLRMHKDAEEIACMRKAIAAAEAGLTATLPLIAGERTFGALMIYSAQPEAFDAEEMARLGELAGDLAYGITALRASSERKQAVAAQQASEQDFRSLAEAMPQIVWVTRPDGWNIYFNQQWVDYTGLTLEESYGHGWSKPFHLRRLSCS